MEVPHYSVVLAAQNAAETIRWSIASILASNGHAFELILVDDDSTDETLDIMVEVAALDWRIKTLSQPRSGFAKACNHGAIAARGEWIAFLDPNDVWAGDKLTRQRTLEGLDPTISATFERTDAFEGQRWASPHQQVLQLCTEKELTTSGLWAEKTGQSVKNLIVRRTAFEKCKGFEEKLEHSEFEDLLARLEASGERVVQQSGDEHKRTSYWDAIQRQMLKAKAG